MSDRDEIRRALRARCRHVRGHGPQNPADLLSDVASWCRDRDVEFDAYGTGELLTNFEREVAELLGFPAARCMPTGKVAQSVALKIWSERAANDHFGMHPTSHLELHEARGYAHLFGLRATLVGPSDRPMLAEHVRAVDEPMSTVLTELPIREAGGQLPTWDQLEELKQTAKQIGSKLHLDGARLWECKPFYERSYAEICAGFDSVYVSFYKGIGGLYGAMLLGSEDFIQEAAIWQRRAGGELCTLLPSVASAAMLFEDRIARMPAYYRRTCEIAELLHDCDGIRTLPHAPQTNMMHVFLPWSRETALRARDRVAEDRGVWLVDGVRDADVPNWSRFEWYVGEAACAVDLEEFADLFDRFSAAARD